VAFAATMRPDDGLRTVEQGHTGGKIVVTVA
jgi:hypothetical protein